MKQLNDLIEDELSHPKKHEPICRGKIVAFLCIGVCILSVPVNFIMRKILAIVRRH